MDPFSLPFPPSPFPPFQHTHTHTHTLTLELQSADGSLSAVLETPKVEGNRRRPRWKWSPISTQILTEAFKKVGRLAHMSSVYWLPSPLTVDITVLVSAGAQTVLFPWLCTVSYSKTVVRRGLSEPHTVVLDVKFCPRVCVRTVRRGRLSYMHSWKHINGACTERLCMDRQFMPTDPAHQDRWLQLHGQV